jgi:hypothetical protein
MLLYAIIVSVSLKLLVVSVVNAINRRDKKMIQNEAILIILIIWIPITILIHYEILKPVIEFLKHSE